MNKQDCFQYIDHTNLKQTATWEDILKIGQEVQQYHMASAMIQPCYVKRLRETFPDLKIGTVIGFPNGYNTTACKVFEAKEALDNGADEVDLVINNCWVKNREWDLVLEELRAVRSCVNRPFVLKVIIETCFLNEEEKIHLCKLVTDAGADFIKTSTGFGSAGATREDIELFKKNIGEKVQMKPAGGIRTAQDILDYVELGCTRIGASAAISALDEE